MVAIPSVRPLGRGWPGEPGPDRLGLEFDVALERARTGDVDRRSALALLRGARSRENARRLFAAASEARDRHLGRELQLTAHLHMVTPCELDPACRYCSLSSTIRSVRDERAPLTERDLRKSVRYAEERGVRSIVLVGGTDPRGSDASVRKVVEIVRRVSDLELALDVGPSLSAGTVEWLKRENVRTIYCSLETVRPSAFRRAKPGDDLDARIAFNSMLERHGMDLGNVVMNGLGGPADLLSSILYLRRFRRLSHLYLSTFHPVRGTPWARKRPASVATSLRALAIARLVFPAVQLGLAEVEVEDPGSGARAAAQLGAGGGNTLAGILIYRNRRVDNVGRILREVAGEGYSVPGLPAAGPESPTGGD